MPKRPLCLFAVSFMIFIFLLRMFAVPPRSCPGLTDETLAESGGTVFLTGRLYKKETKNDHLIYYLKDIQILEFYSLNKQSKQISGTIHEKLNTKTQTGAVCYMSPSVEGEEPIGRWLYVKGEVLPLEEAENEGQFDAKAYYQGIGFGIRLWDTRLLSQGKNRDIFGDAMVDIKQDISGIYHANMKPENAGILAAMLLGDKTSMDTEIKNLYRKNGISHVLAISGLHISLIGMLLYRFLRRIYLPPPLCCIFGVGFVLVYIKMVGFGVSSFRAVCMFVMYMLADLLERTYDLLTALAFSALLLLVENPGAMFEAGFLLSYFAVLGLALVLPVMQGQVETEYADELSGKNLKELLAEDSVFKFLVTCGRKIISALLPGYSVQVLIFPITLWFYYEFPLYSFLLNLVVVPCMSVVLVGGCVGAVPGCSAALRVTEFLLDFYEWLCRSTEVLPGAVIVTGRPKVWQIVLYYGLIALWFVKSRQCSRRGGSIRKIGIVLFPLCCMLLFLFPVHRENRLDMLSVGQGDCVVMQDLAGNVVLVDGGSTDVAQVGKYRLLPFLKYHGISEIDAVFLSHAHEDHYSAIVELLESAGEEGVRIRTLCLTGHALGRGSKSEETDAAKFYAQLALLASGAGCEIVYLEPGDWVSCGKMTFESIYPSSGSWAADENDASMVLLGRLADFSVLFTGDSSMACDQEVIRRVCSRGVPAIDCLKVAHHGAQTSTGTELLETFDFKLALISCGKGNSYGHPHAALISRLQKAGCETFVTAECGQITVRIRRGKARVNTYRH